MFNWHFRQNLVCVIDTETTGLDPIENDIIEICVLPLDANFDPSGDPFYTQMKPRYPENVNEEALKVNKKTLAEITLNGLDYYVASELFEKWFEELKLPIGKKIIPLGHNYIAFDKPFIQEWLGMKSYESYFDYCVRDTMTAALFANDNAYLHKEPYPYGNIKLTGLANALNVEHNELQLHSALADCIVTAKVYKAMLHQKTAFDGIMMQRLKQRALENEDIYTTLNRILP